MKKLLALAALAAVLISANAASADDWPNRPVRVLTTTGPGGISDVFMRVLGEELRKRLGQNFVVENRPGGMQNVGARACTEARPDGYTICIINADPVVYNPLLLKNIGFDPQTGLQPITNLFHLIQVLVINSNLKANTIDELVELSKKQPGTLSYLTAAPPLMLYMETLKKEKGADWVRVPFKGGGQAVNAVLGGSTPIALIGEGNVIGQINAGKMRELVMVNNIHSPLYPKVPTLEESGYKGPPSHTWYGLFAPHGTPKPIVDRIYKEVKAIVADPAFTKKNITDRSLVPDVAGPEAFAKQIEADRAIAREVVKEAGLKPQ
ncbi:MAG TPA: tripartite tricarboxylate transporter substrate binding protein [Pseudolabrys sp.]|nr:tripartite tricarboxylate transporter substrate binding protein [Pseudolabrys sp.]